MAILKSGSTASEAGASAALPKYFQSLELLGNSRRATRDNLRNLIGSPTYTRTAFARPSSTSSPLPNLFVNAAIIAVEARFKEASDLEVWERCVGGRRVSRPAFNAENPEDCNNKLDIRRHESSATTSWIFDATRAPRRTLVMRRS